MALLFSCEVNEGIVILRRVYIWVFSSFVGWKIKYVMTIIKEELDVRVSDSDNVFVQDRT